ncbi:MAG: ABC transporter substrate-binding protein [Pseudomonadota bacterium]
MPQIVALLLSFLLTLATPLTAETRQVTDDLGRTVKVPAQPKRIVTTESQSLAVPLIELGILPIGSHGMLHQGQTAALRGNRVTTGIDFDTDDIRFLGMRQVDLEAFAALKPDLILHSVEVEAYTGITVDMLSAIAPVIAYRSFDRPPGAIHLSLADATGQTAEPSRLSTRLEAQMAQLKKLSNPENTRVSVFLPEDGQIFAEHTWGTLGYILREAGFAFAPIIDAIPEGESRLFSAENLPEFDADWFFLTYRNDAGQRPADTVAQMERVFPGWCDLLRDCREGRVLFLPRDEAASSSYGSAMAMIYAILPALSDPLRQP